MKIKKSLIFVLVFVLVFLSFFLASIVFVLFFQVNEDEESYNDESFVHRYVKFNPETDKYSFGFVERPYPLGEEYLSTTNEFGELLLVSDFATTQYKCYGSCVCENIERRVFSGTLRKIPYLLAAITSIAAFNLAGKYFDNECKGLLEKDDCPLHAIKSEVEDCEPVDGSKVSEDAGEEVEEKVAEIEEEKEAEAPADGGDDDDAPAEEEVDDGFEEAKVTRIFRCTGKCLPYKLDFFFYDANPQLGDDTFLALKDIVDKMSRVFRCFRLKLTEEFDIKMPTDEWIKEDSGEEGVNIVRRIYMTENLQEMCSDRSVKGVKIPGSDQFIDLSMCMGFYMLEEENFVPQNPTVKCLEKFE